MNQESSTHFQDSSHKEGNQGNTPPKGQPREGGNPQSMPDMNQDSQEQSAGNKKQEEKNEDTEGIP